jgi:hypothetical protein
MTSPEQGQQQIERLIRWNARCTTVLLGLFVVLVAVAAWVAVLEGRRWLDADRVVDAGESYLKERYPGWREELKQSIAGAAPAVARRMTKRLERSLAGSRSALEGFLVRADIGVDSTQPEVVAQEEFREYVRGEREEVRRVLAGETAVPALEQSLGKWFGKKWGDEAAAALTEFARLNNRLTRLTNDGDLTDLEKVERRIVQRLRALQARREKEEK